MPPFEQRRPVDATTARHWLGLEGCGAHAASMLWVAGAPAESGSKRIFWLSPASGWRWWKSVKVVLLGGSSQALAQLLGVLGSGAARWMRVDGCGAVAARLPLHDDE